MADLNIQSIGPTTPVQKSGKANAIQKGPDESSFGQWLTRSLHEVSKIRKDADAASLKLATGETKDIHGTMIKMQKAEIATSLMVEVRNKVIAAYEEVKRMQF